MNPVISGMLLAYSLLAEMAPWRRASGRRPAVALVLEFGALAVVVAAALWAGRLTGPLPYGQWWGLVMLYLAGYWYACAGGVAVVRLVLRFVPVSDGPGPPGALTVSPVEQGRGRIIGVLERALALTLVLLGQFAALGLIVAAKALARFKALEDRDFAEYFLIGTLASLLHALLVGIGLGMLT
jgi:hypothetical protein